MALFTVDNRQFEVIVASDTDFDGLAWELWEDITTERSHDRIYLLQIIRHDDSKKIAFKTFESFNIPIEAIEKLFDSFNTTGGRDFMEDIEYE